MSSHSLFSFDQVIDRRGTACSKWDDVEKLFGAPDVLPMWVADMDFACPQSVQKALADRVAHGVFGYVSPRDSYTDALTGWLSRRHQFTIERDWVVNSPGVVPAINVLIQALTQQGDAVLIQPPVYAPFEASILRNDRRVITNPLVVQNGRYVMDLADCEQKIIQENVRLMILCSPHNPIGRVWTRDELQALGDLCLRHQVFVISDEIHHDLLFPGVIHTPYASISPALAALSATCVAPSKTFNIAGLQTAFTILPEQESREKFKAELTRYGYHAPNVFGAIAAETAYREGDSWLDALMIYLEGNAQIIEETLLRDCPELTWIRPEGTYLAWLDCRALGFEQKELSTFFEREARVGLNSGHTFGAGGDGFMRLNFGCPRSLLEEGLQRIHKAIQAHAAQ